jgi:hypothetical protein
MNSGLISKMFALFVNSIVLMYIDFVEKNCSACSDLLEKDILKNLTKISVGLILLSVIAEKPMVEFLHSNQIIAIILSTLGFINFITLYRFIGYMKTEPCDECTKNWRRKFLYIYSRTILALYFFMFAYQVHVSLTRK